MSRRFFFCGAHFGMALRNLGARGRFEAVEQIISLDAEAFAAAYFDVWFLGLL